MADTTIYTLGGRPVDFRRPPRATDLVRWSKKDSGGDTITASFRSIAHMDRLNRLALARFGQGIVVLQPPYNRGVSASAGTHDFDATWDIYIPGVDWWKQQTWLRANGFACWYRHPPSFGHHIHGFTLPPREGSSISDDFRVHGFKVGKYVDGGWSLFGSLVTSSQLADYYNHAFGLSGQHTTGSDRTWYPKRIASTIFDLDKYVEHRRKQQQEDNVPTKPLKVHGADASHHQGHLDLRKAKAAGLQFLYHKVGEGDTFVDPEYDERRRQAKAAGVPFGAYWFARAEWLGGRTDAVMEARRLVKLADPKPGDLIPALDLETAEGLTQEQLRIWARKFSDEVRRLIGVRPVVYSQWNLRVPTPARWVPRYNSVNEPPTIPWDIWQFSDGKDGVPNQFPGLGHVDLNHFAPETRLSDILIKPEPDVLRVITFNMWVGNKDPRQNLTNLVDACHKQFGYKPDALSIQEAKTWHGTIPGYNRVAADVPGRPESDSTILLVRTDHKLGRDRTLVVTGPDWVGPKHDLRHEPRVFPGRSISVRGRAWDLLGIHRTPGGPTSRNAASWKAEDEDLVAWEERADENRPKRAAAWVGDWNDRTGTIHRLSVSSLARRVDGDLRMRGIDGAIGLGCEVTRAHEFSGLFGGDGHNPVLFEFKV